MLRILFALLPLLAASPAWSDEPTDAPADHQGSRKLIVQEDAAAITLHSRDASVHGKTLRYEPAPEKTTLGYWSDAADWASWDFEVIKPGDYEVRVLQGCGKGSGGAEVEISAGAGNVRFTVEDTGHFQNFIERNVGAVSLAAGRQTLSVHARTKPGGAVMDLRQVVLVPVKAK